MAKALWLTAALAAQWGAWSVTGTDAPFVVVIALLGLSAVFGALFSGARPPDPEDDAARLGFAADPTPRPRVRPCGQVRPTAH